jgi:hypothetical protein
MEQVNFISKKTGKPDSFTKFEVECQVGNESITYEANGFHRSKLEVGGHYALEIQPSDYTHNIRKIEPIQATGGHLVRAAEAMGAVITEEVVVAPPPNPTPTPPSNNSVAVPQNAKQGIPQGPPLRPDVKVRWEQNQMHARTAQMQATERVRMFVDLAIAGKLLNDEGEPVDKLRKSTVAGWFSNEIDRYWDELEVRKPEDAYGDLTEVRNVSS